MGMASPETDALAKAAVCDHEGAALLFNVIFRLLSNVILMIRNGCLPKLGHLQSKVKQNCLRIRQRSH